VKREREPASTELVQQQRRFAELAIPLPTAATYDTTTEGKTGWRFVLTRRWIAFFVGVIVFAGGCVAGVIWQAQLGAQISQFNATVSRNFNATPVPLRDVLPTIGSYRASEQWKPVIATGTYATSSQLYVRNRTCGSDTGFEVLTPLLVDGRMLVIDRGCVASSSANPNIPSPTAAPPAGMVTVTARIVAGEAPQGSVSAAEAAQKNIANQVDSIDLKPIAKRLGAPTYTGAYGMLESQLPAPTKSLHRVISGRPSVDASAQEGTIFGTVLYAIVGLVIFGYALRQKFRFVNRFDPRLWQREWKRIQRQAARPLTDAEIEDLQIAHDQRPRGEASTALARQDPEPPVEESPPGDGPVIVGGAVDWETKPKKR
jgi:cytochrome oxidase assembly protein ShyY1